MGITRWTISCLIFVVSSQAPAQQAALSGAEVVRLLAERDALIIALQHEVNDLRERLGTVEGLLDVDSTAADPAQAEASESASSPAPAQDVRADASDPTRLSVDEAAAERALERTLVQRGVLLLPRGTIEFGPGLAYSHNQAELPDVAASDAGSVLGVNRFERTAFNVGLNARFGLPLDSQLEVAIPYLSVTEKSSFVALSQPTSSIERSGNGTGDFDIGFAKTIMRENGRRPDLIGRIGWNPGRADTIGGGISLGGGFESVHGSLTLVKRRDPLALYFALGYADFRERNGVDPGNPYDIIFGTGFAVSPDSSLFGSIRYQSSPETKVEGREVEGTDVAVTTLNLGLSTVLRRGALLSIFAEIGISDTAPDYSLGFSAPMQWRLRR